MLLNSSFAVTLKELHNSTLIYIEWQTSNCFAADFNVQWDDLCTKEKMELTELLECHNLHHHVVGLIYTNRAYN